MTTQNISELSSFFTTQSMSNVASSTKAQAGGSAFSEMMGKATEGTSSVDVKSQVTSDSRQGGSARIVNESGRREVKVSDKTPDNADKDLDQNTLQEKADEAASQITEEIKEQLDVTDEDIQNAMEVLGLTMADLFDSSALQELYTQLSPAEDALSLLTNEEMYQGLQEVIQTLDTVVSQLQDSLNLTEEEFNAVLDQLSNNQTEIGSEFTAVASEPLDDGLVMADTDVPSEEGPVVLSDKAMTTQNEELNPSETEIPVTDSEMSQVSVEHKTETGENKKQDTEGDGQTGNQFNTFNVNVVNTDTVVADTQATAFSYTDVSETQEIARQIIDQIQVRVTEETTSLEMELNPASLGHVGLSIEAKNGAVTAAFTAQNEAVRAAIESQIVQLQERLEDQGVKVEAVEVTIASHEFEQNLEQNANEQQQREEASRAINVAGRRHRINLLSDEDDEEDEALSEEEAINRDMMIRNGNSVDITA